MYTIKAPKTYSSNADDYKSFPITFSLTGDALENFAREVLKMLGLFTESDIGGYNRLFGGDIVKHFMNELGETKQAIAEAKKKKKLSLSINVSVATEIIEQINKYLTDPDALPVSEMSAEEKLAEVIKRAALLLPANIGKELLALLDPTTLAIVAVVVVAWAVSHFFGIGEIADVIMLIVGVISLGPIAWKAGEHLINFAYKTINGKTSEDLDQAAKDLSEAVALIGVQVVMALLLKKAPKVFRENPKYSTLQLKQLPKTQRPANEWFYKPNIQPTNNLNPGVLGNTSIYGDIKYLSRLTSKLKTETILHEKVHAFLTPKLYPLRNLRITINWNGYAKSYLLRYLEEALAETIAQIGTYGIKNAIVGVKFPVREGYVTLAEMRVEVNGILLGPVNAGGMIWFVYYNTLEKY